MVFLHGWLSSFRINSDPQRGGTGLGLAICVLNPIAFGGAKCEAGEVPIMTLLGIVDVYADDFVVDCGHMADTVECVTLLIHSDNDTGLLGLYAKQLEARVRGLEALLGCDDPYLRDAQARLCN